MTHPDATLDYWADRFVHSGVADLLSFEQFMELSPALRERRIAQIDIVRDVQQRVDQGMPDATVHGNRLIDPIHHGLREYRQPLYYRRRRHA